MADKIINYRELIDRSTQGFVGRRWVREAVDTFLAAAGPRAFLLLDTPRSGKSCPDDQSVASLSCAAAP